METCKSSATAKHPPFWLVLVGPFKQKKQEEIAILIKTVSNLFPKFTPISFFRRVSLAFEEFQLREFKKMLGQCPISFTGVYLVFEVLKWRFSVFASFA